MPYPHRKLSNTQVYHHISRANFSAERGIRYGQDFYDERVQASTRLEITPSSSDELYNFSVSNEQTAQKQETNGDEKDAHGSEVLQEGIENLNLEHLENENNDEKTAAEGEAIENLSLEHPGNESKDETSSPGEEEAEKKDTKPKPPKTPLSWFGILTPGAQSLRSAQTASTLMTSTIIPKMASLDGEMKEMEIRIRRARKFRAKADAEILKKEKIHARNADVKASVV